MLNLDLPLHPIVVHFPVALGVLAPAVFMIVTWGIARKKWPYKMFVIPVVFQIVLFLSALAALKLGEEDEEKVEVVVEKALIHEHEEWGERLVWFQGGLLAISGAALLFPGRMRIKKTATALSIIGAGLTGITGHSGGELVYKYNAGKAYLK